MALPALFSQWENNRNKLLYKSLNATLGLQNEKMLSIEKAFLFRG